ncbi:DNA-directed RNA polymerase subunit alpha C-terminal domain-containing protein [Actinocorallia sp. B10E7]|uniref:WD40 repeat domain-containing protein n=1 Tax=Actinocorallia sp. B10E7 TaxID=3153558 RepID=UPI00325C861A
MPIDWPLPISYFGVHVRTYNCLRRAGIYTIGELVVRSERDLLELEGSTPELVEELKRELAAIDLSLRVDPSDDVPKHVAFIRHDYRVSVRAVAFHPGGRLLATAGWEEKSCLRDGSTGKVVGDPANPLAAVLEADKSQGSWDDFEASRTARLWDTVTGEPVGVPLTGHTDKVWGVAFHPDGHLLATASSDDSARLWDTATGEPVGNPLSGHIRNVYTVAFHPEGHLLATAGWDTGVRLWEVSNRRLITLFDGHDSTIHSAAFHPGGDFLATGYGDGTVRLWSLDGDSLAVLTGHTEGIKELAFHPDGELLATASWDGTVRLWDTRAGQEVGVLPGHGQGANTVAFHPEGHLLATAGLDCTVRLWDLATRRLQALFIGHTWSTNAVAFHPGGDLLATAGQDGAVLLWPLPAPPS